jgi:hypothetical protein
VGSRRSGCGDAEDGEVWELGCMRRPRGCRSLRIVENAVMGAARDRHRGLMVAYDCLW